MRWSSPRDAAFLREHALIVEHTAQGDGLADHKPARAVVAVLRDQEGNARDLVTPHSAMNVSRRPMPDIPTSPSQYMTEGLS